jgi:hypothetical protein
MECRQKVPQAITVNFFVLRLMCALANGVSVTLSRRRGLGKRSDVTVDSEVRLLIRFLLDTPLTRRHLGASKQVYPAAACDRNQKFRLSGRK